ncbi:MAG: hypothetical protein ACT6XY_15195 [Phreatobacter sp.]|jgi:hypothetical protein|uniref:hypothetical protein n=1 Tax=Phreatobacter sp. TaxID=1966341 RepID=UPI0040366D72
MNVGYRVWGRLADRPVSEGDNRRAGVEWVAHFHDAPHHGQVDVFSIAFVAKRPVARLLPAKIAARAFSNLLQTRSAKSGMRAIHNLLTRLSLTKLLERPNRTILSSNAQRCHGCREAPSLLFGNLRTNHKPG